MDFEYAQINDDLKDLIFGWYNELEKQYSQIDMVMSKLTSKVYMLRNIEPDAYKMILGMSFADSVRVLSYKLSNTSVSPSEMIDWKTFHTATDITDLIAKVDSGEISLKRLIEGSIEFDMMDLEKQYLCYQSSNQGYLLKFNPYALSEYLDIVKPCSLEEIIEAYREISENMEDPDLEDEDREEMTRDLEDLLTFFRNKLMVLAHTDNKEFKRIIMLMVNAYYRITKAYEKIAGDKLLDIEEEILNIIEEESLEDIFGILKFSPDKCILVIDTYLDYEVNGSDFDEAELDDCFEEFAPEKVKQKLKK